MGASETERVPGTDSSPRPGVAVLGCGHWGRNLVRNLHEMGALKAVADPDSESVSQLQNELRVKATNLATILDDDRIRGVAIAAPASLHYELAKTCLEAGKDVFVEKPLALQVDQAKEITGLAEEFGSVLMVGHLMQYHPAFLTLKELVDDGRLGRMQYVYSNRLNLGRFRQEEDILWSFAPHDISMILSLIGDEPKHVRAIGSYHLDSEIADVTTTHLSFLGGERAHVYVSWLHPYKEQRLVAVGDEGMAVFDDGEPWERKLQLYPHRILWEKGVPQPVKADAEPVALDAKEPLRMECAHFLECVATRAKPRTDGREGIRVLEVLTRAAESMKRAEWT